MGSKPQEQQQVELERIRIDIGINSRVRSSHADYANIIIVCARY